MTTIKTYTPRVLFVLAMLWCYMLYYSSATKEETIAEKDELLSGTIAELNKIKDDQYALSNQKIQKNMRFYRSCASEFLSNLTCMDKAQQEIADAKKFVNNDEKYYRIKEAKGTWYVDIHADSIIEFLSE